MLVDGALHCQRIPSLDVDVSPEAQEYRELLHGLGKGGSQITPAIRLNRALVNISNETFRVPNREAWVMEETYGANNGS